MRRIIKPSKQTSTGSIKIDSQKCEACWKCMEACPNNVIGKINLPWHKHARIVAGDNCIACLKCVKVCEFNAVINFQN